MGDAHIVHICLRDGIEVDLHGDVAIVFPLEAMGKLKAVDVGGFILYNLCAGTVGLTCLALGWMKKPSMRAEVWGVP